MRAPLQRGQRNSLAVTRGRLATLRVSMRLRLLLCLYEGMRLVRCRHQRVVVRALCAVHRALRAVPVLQTRRTHFAHVGAAVAPTFFNLHRPRLAGYLGTSVLTLGKGLELSLGRDGSCGFGIVQSATT